MKDHPYMDEWKHDVSQALGRIEANIEQLMSHRESHDTRITIIEARQNKWAGVALAAAAIIPFFTDKIKSIFFG